MPTHVLGVPRLVLGLMLCLAAPLVMAKPPDLPLPVHPELAPEERPLAEGAAPEAVKPAEPEIFFFPLVEPIAPMAEAKDSEEEQEPRAMSGCPLVVQILGALFAGPFGSPLWAGEEEQEPKQAAAVFGSYDVSDLMGETAGNNVVVRPSEKKLARQLIRYIEGRVRPGSWESQGGAGSIEYNAETNSLTVRHDDEVQQEVAGLLDNLRQLPALGSSVRTWLLGTGVAKQLKWSGGEEASSVRESAKPAAPALVAMGHDLSDIMEGRDADEVVRELTRTIETVIAPSSWHNRGGMGRLDYNPELKCFFIMQSPEVQDAIRSLIDLKRYDRLLQDRARFEVWSHNYDDGGAIRFLAMRMGFGFFNPFDDISSGCGISRLMKKAYRELIEVKRQQLRQHKKAVEDEPSEPIGYELPADLLPSPIVDPADGGYSSVGSFHGLHEVCRECRGWLGSPFPLRDWQKSSGERLQECRINLLIGCKTDAELQLRYALDANPRAVFADPVLSELKPLNHVLEEYRSLHGTAFEVSGAEAKALQTILDAERFASPFRFNLRCPCSEECDPFINGLLSDAYEALITGRREKAKSNMQTLLAVAHNREKVLADPLACRIQLLAPDLTSSGSAIESVRGALTVTTEHLKAAQATEQFVADLSWQWKFGNISNAAPTIEEEIADTLVQSHEALLLGNRSEAEGLLRKALAIDREAVLAHPLIYKMQLLSQVLSEPETIKPRMPGIDPGVIRAYHEILESAPKRTCDEVRPAAEKKLAVLEIQEEACELEIVTDKPAGGPALCIDRDGQRLRVQLQMLGWTFKLTEDSNGKAAFSIGWTK